MIFVDRLPLLITFLVIITIVLFTIVVIALPFYLLYKNKTDTLEIAEGLDNSFLQKLDCFNHLVGTYVCWMILFMSLIQFVLVVMRYVFSIGSLPLQESIIYLHGMLFLLAAGYTYKNEGHVRVDIFYGKMSKKTAAIVNLLGAIFLLSPVLLMTGFYSFNYVLNSWAVFETSPEGMGLPFLYILKTTIWAFVILMAVETIIVIIKNLHILRK